MALELMGGAVLNGGITTFLAVILLSDSTSYALITFFKVFFLTVLFGLFHALVFLPVVLCLELPIPSKPNKSSKPNATDKSIIHQNSTNARRKSLKYDT